ncbi:hypothetical protein [Emticicia sp. 17c]|uniref:hypothetical protein n=1 Tax=Emticicia sp. 17c TaxID=3127704 RepID=UPI00301BC6E9
MRPQNQSERQGAIFRFWAIYIIVLILPMVAFFYIFRNSGGSSKDYDNLQIQIKEFERLTKLTEKLDSLSKKIIEIDLDIVKPGPPTTKLNLKDQAKHTVNNIDRVIKNMEESKPKAKSEAVKKFITNINTFLNNYVAYHNAFMEKVDFQTSSDDKNAELSQLRLENTKINGEVGQLKSQVEGLRIQLANCNK